MKAFDALIPTRFMASICFLISVIMVFSTMADNIIVSLPSTYTQASYNSHKSSLNLALSLHIICICLNLAGFLFGFSMFIPSHTILVIISHTIGCIYACVAIMETWHYLNFWYIFAFFAAPVALLEACIVIGTFSLGSLNIT